MDPQQLQIVLNQLAQALGVPPPPPLEPDQITSTRSVISQLLAVLGMAGNLGDSDDMAAAEAGQAERELRTGEAMMKFPANEAQSAQAMQQVMGMAQQVPQALSGVGQGVGGIFGGLVQQLNQALQQGVQAGQQLASGLGGAGGDAAELAAELPAETLGDPLGAGGALLGAGAAGAGGLGSTMPASTLGPPATPSAATFPSSSSGTTTMPGAPEPAGPGRGAMGGYPMMPPGAMGGPNASGGETKADTKRVMSPAVKNGSPVQGRVSIPSALPEVTRRIDGRPATTRRIIGPESRVDRNDLGSNH